VIAFTGEWVIGHAENPQLWKTAPRRAGWKEVETLWHSVEMLRAAGRHHIWTSRNRVRAADIRYIWTSRDSGGCPVFSGSTRAQN
jgi:hypothetical protein